MLYNSYNLSYICTTERILEFVRGHFVPSFITLIMFETKVRKLLEEGLAAHSGLFLIDFSVSADNRIKVVIDGDDGVRVEDCIKISRAIEHNLDREEGDFSLEVTSAGATEPLVVSRQYPKNIGRKLAVHTEADAYEGTLTEVGEAHIVLEWKAREPKPVGKGKHTVQKRKELPFEAIKKAKVILKY